MAFCAEPHRMINLNHLRVLKRFLTCTVYHAQDCLHTLNVQLVSRWFGNFHNETQLRKDETNFIAIYIMILLLYTVGETVPFITHIQEGVFSNPSVATKYINRGAFEVIML